MMGLAGNNQSHPVWRWLTIIATGAGLAFAPIGCAYPELSMPTRPAGIEIPIPMVLFGAGTLAAPNATGKAITYNPELAPIGAVTTGILTVIPLPNGSTRAQLTVFGLLPNRGYAAHAHVNACGATGAAAGPHFQNHLDPAATPQQPSSDPQYANPSNEIWLDLRTNSAGASTSRTTVPFTFTDRAPGSIVIHEAMQTSTGPGQAGKAGARIACLTLAKR